MRPSEYFEEYKEALRLGFGVSTARGSNATQLIKHLESIGAEIVIPGETKDPSAEDHRTRGNR